MSNVQNNIPKHVAIIMDGNRRWAKKRGLPAVMGHKKVVEDVLEKLIARAGEVGVSHITFWAFSTENWKRDENEVGGIMDLFRFALAKRAQKMIDKGARLRVIGDVEAFPDDIKNGIKKMIVDSVENEAINVTFALNYGGRDEIIRAIKKLLEEKSQITNHKSQTKELNFDKYLDTVGIPDPDLIIRTGGEQRLSGFMLWQSEYSELYFPETLMPDFGPDEFDLAIEEYGNRQRRFGK